MAQPLKHLIERLVQRFRPVTTFDARNHGPSAASLAVSTIYDGSIWRKFDLPCHLPDFDKAIIAAVKPCRVLARCNICGSSAAFLASSMNLREDLICVRCGNWNRKRQLVAVMMSTLGGSLDRPLVEQASLMQGRVWLMESGPLEKTLRLGSCRLISSEYFSPEHVSGDTYNGVRHEDVMSPSFEDNSLNLVLSSDVLEHVPDAYRAHEAILRTLQPGGQHIFTVPCDLDNEHDDVRAEMKEGRIVHIAPAEYHGDPLRPEGALVFRVFGREMIGRLESMGYLVSIYHVYSPFHAILGNNGLVFVAKKRDCGNVVSQECLSKDNSISTSSNR